MKPSELWKCRLDRMPGLAPYLEPIAKKWAKGQPLPKTMTLGPEPRDPELRAFLSRIFGKIDYREGKLVAAIPAPMRNYGVLEALAEQLGVKRKTTDKTETSVASTLQRFRLLHPKLDPIHRWMASSAEIDRLFSNMPRQENLLGGLLKTATYLADNDRPVTLSKLGSLFFNDSKLLRNKNAVPYNLLGRMMLQLLDIEDCPQNREIALQQFGVVNNPATSNAALYGPLTLVRNDVSDTWIADRHRLGEIATINSTNLEKVDAIQLPEGYNTVITSENAAPFHELMLENLQATILYTGGYPNATVCRLLGLLHNAGVVCKHWGDSDPDGLLIASLVGRYIETSLFRCSLDDVLRHATDLIPLKGNAIQLGRGLLKTHPDFKFREELELVIETGHWLEQERWTPPA